MDERELMTCERTCGLPYRPKGVQPGDVWINDMEPLPLQSSIPFSHRRPLPKLRGAWYGRRVGICPMILDMIKYLPFGENVEFRRMDKADEH